MVAMGNKEVLVESEVRTETHIIFATLNLMLVDGSILVSVDSTGSASSGHASIGARSASANGSPC